MLSITSAHRVHRRYVRKLPLLTLALCSALLYTGAALAQTLNTLVNFNGNGYEPLGNLIADAKGDLFGITNQGGAYGYGTVFEISYNAGTGTYATAPTTLVTFNFSNGAFPDGSLLIDNRGNLLGTTASGGGPTSAGTVFEIPYNATAGTYATEPVTLVTFDNTDGSFPIGSLASDAHGNLFGVTEYGGSSNVGTVFEVLRNATTGTYATAPITIASFDYTNGGFPQAGLAFDPKGNLFGTTTDGGEYQYGTIFEIPYHASTHSYATSPLTLVNFNYADGGRPYAGLTVDTHGDLFGTANLGGDYNVGTVFELPYNEKTHSYATSPNTLVNFDGSDGAYPIGGVIADASGNLFGTTSGDFGSNGGTVFELAKTATGYASTPTTLVFFGGSNGAYPFGGLIANTQGDLFGTTLRGGTAGSGTVFEILGSGFVTTKKFEGTPGKGDCATVSISALAHTYGGIDHAATDLGYPSVESLHAAVTSYCSR